MKFKEFFGETDSPPPSDEQVKTSAENKIKNYEDVSKILLTLIGGSIFVSFLMLLRGGITFNEFIATFITLVLVGIFVGVMLLVPSVRDYYNMTENAIILCMGTSFFLIVPFITAIILSMFLDPGKKEPKVQDIIDKYKHVFLALFIIIIILLFITTCLLAIYYIDILKCIKKDNFDVTTEINVYASIIIGSLMLFMCISGLCLFFLNREPFKSSPLSTHINNMVLVILLFVYIITIGIIWSSIYSKLACLNKQYDPPICQLTLFHEYVTKAPIL